MLKKNGFVMYLDSRKEFLLEKGHTLNGGYQQLADLCTTGWERLSHSEKKRFAEEAKHYNEKQVINSRGAFGVGDKLRSVTSEVPQPGQTPIQKTMLKDDNQVYHS